MNLKQIEYKYFNERDIEIPALIEFLKERIEKIDSLLDVGCHFSQYAGKIRKLLPRNDKTYHGCDIILDENIEAIVD